MLRRWADASSVVPAPEPTAMSPLPLYVIIPTAGRATLLARTLDSLAACEKPTGYQRTIVVENGEPGAAREIVSARDEEERIGYQHVDYANKSHALNEAIAEIETGLIVMFDDDVRLDRRILIEYAEAADARGEGVFFGGSFGVDYEETPPEWLRRLLPLSARGVDLRAPEREWHLYLGFNWAVYAQDLHAAGGFDPNFGPGSPTGSTGQEANMQQRLLDAGLEAVDVPGAWCWHYVPRKRSTLAWVLKRKHRGGLQSGLDPLSQAQHVMLSRLGRSAFSIAKRGLLFDRAGFWQAVAATSHWTGVVRGYAMRRRRPSTS